MYRRHHAFTLLELAAVLVIVSLMTGFGLQIFQTSSGMDCYAATESQLKVINRAMETFAAKDSRLPKPSFPSLGSSSPRFGMEATDGADPGVVADDRTVAAYGTMIPVDPDVTGAMTNAGGVLIGALPHSDLGLSVDYASDCWGNKFTYAVTNVLTSKDGATGYPAGTAVGAITLNSGGLTTTNLMSDKIDYVVLSHGMNKFGATPMSANNVAAANHCNGSPGSIIDKENCDKTNATFYNSVRNIGSGATDYFDDIVVFGKNLAKGGGGDTNLYCWGTDNSGTGALADNSFVSGHSSFIPKKATSTVTFSNFAEYLPNAQGAASNGCGLTCDGTAYCWGENSHGQIGDNTQINKAVPTAASTSVKFSKLYITGYFSTVCGLQRNADGSNEGTAYCWGYNGGRAGIGSSSPFAIVVPTAVNTTALPVAARKFKQLAAKNNTICALAMNSSVYCWGGDPVDRGSPGVADASSPEPVQGGRKFGAIAGGHLFCGITNGLDPAGAGKIYCWGDGSYDSLDQRGIFLSDPIPIASITRANPAVITTAIPHTLGLRDQFVVRRTNGMGLITNKGTRAGNPVALNNTSYNFYNVANGTGLTATNVRPSTSLWDSFTGFNSSAQPAYTGGGELIITGSPLPRLLPNQGSLIFTSFADMGISMTTSSTVTAVTSTGEIRSWGLRARSGYSNLGDGASLPSEATISSISRSNPAVATTSSAHNLVPGDSIYLHSLPGMPQMARGILKVGATPTALTFEIQDSGGAPIDSSSFGATTGIASYNKVPTGCYVHGTYAVPCTYAPVAPSGGHTVANGKMVGFGTFYLRSFIDSAGRIKTWGSTYTGDNTSNSRDTPVNVRTSANAILPNVFTRLYNMSDIFCAIDSVDDGYCWGINFGGQRGINTNTDRYSIAPINGGYKWLEFARVQTGAAVCGLTKVTPACPAPTSCGDETIYWGSGCAAQTSTRGNGITATIANQSTGRTGNADITCSNGSYIVDNTTCAANGCTDQTVAIGGGCSVQTGTRADGYSASHPNIAVGFTGSATVSCNAGVVSISGATCGQNCIAGTTTWGACAGPAGAATHGAPGVVVANTNSGQVGNVTVACNNGTFTQSGATCAPAPPSNCVSQAVSWGTGCSATAPGLNHGDNTGVSNGAAGRVGTATASCTNGTTTASGTCDLHCTGRSETWGSCAGNTPAINHSNNSSVSNTNGGFTGAVTMSCTNGTLSQSSASCTPVAPATCAAGWSNPYIYSYEGDMGACLAYTYTIGNCTSGTGGTTASDTGNTNDCIDSITPGCTVRGRICGCLANGQSHTTYGVTGSNPSLCCNGDSDGDGICGGAVTSCIDECGVSHNDGSIWCPSVGYGGIGDTNRCSSGTITQEYNPMCNNPQPC